MEFQIKHGQMNGSWWIYLIAIYEISSVRTSYTSQKTWILTAKDEKILKRTHENSKLMPLIGFIITIMQQIWNVLVNLKSWKQVWIKMIYSFKQKSNNKRKNTKNYKSFMTWKSRESYNWWHCCIGKVAYRIHRIWGKTAIIFV